MAVVTHKVTDTAASNLHIIKKSFHGIGPSLPIYNILTAMLTGMQKKQFSIDYVSHQGCHGYDRLYPLRGMRRCKK